MRSMRAAIAVAACLLLPVVISGGAHAQTCGTDYTVQQGDSLAKIASRAYGKSSQWTLIFYANQDRLGGNTSLLVPGLAIRIPCVGNAEPALPVAATQEAAEPTPAPIVTSGELKRIEFLTGDDYAPFTGRQLPGGGMSTDIVTRAMELFKQQTGNAVEYHVSWVNDWSAHFNPLLTKRAFDMGFPWYQPPCQNFADLDDDGKYRCKTFFFSRPLFEEQVLFFVKKDSPLQLTSDSEVVGKKVCRPAGYWTFDFDADGRRWTKDNKITLIRPSSSDECFRLLKDGEVDVVSENELTGRASIAKLDAADWVRIVDRPMSILTLHVIVPKTNPNARTMLYYVNTALDKLKESGEFDEIVERHLTAFWEQQNEQQPSASKSGTTAKSETAATATDSKAAASGTKAAASDTTAAAATTGTSN